MHGKVPAHQLGINRLASLPPIGLRPWKWTDSGRRIDRSRPVFGGKTMARHRTYSIEFKRQMAQEFLGERPSTG